jgi:hypothetical protein
MVGGMGDWHKQIPNLDRSLGVAQQDQQEEMTSWKKFCVTCERMVWEGY